MKIYTKTGDDGMTSLYGGKRVRKDDLRIDAYGTVDELNSCIGIVRSLPPPRDIDGILHEVQNDLFTAGADLAAPAASATVARIGPSHIRRLEESIDRLEPQLPPLRVFILPGGTVSAAQLHSARTICRRAERLIVHLSQKETIGADLPIYFNRLSDLLFILARYANMIASRPDVPWTGGKNAHP